LFPWFKPLITPLLKDNYGRLIDFLSQISKVSYFNAIDLVDFFMHHWFPGSFLDVATLGVHKYSRTPVLAICAPIRALSLISSSG